MVNPDRIVKMASAFFESCVLFAASDLGLFAKLAELKKADAKTLADSLKLDHRGTRLILDACVGLRLLKKRGEIYRNTKESMAFLVPESPEDLSNAIQYTRDVYPAWGKLKEMIRNGGPVEKPEIHLGQDPERTRTFVMAMHYRALAMGRAPIPLLDLAGKKKILDIGGGPGTYSVLIAQANPEVECTVLDLPEVAKIADELIQKQGMSGRVKTLPGDYRVTPFPGGNDVVNFFGVLHQETPESILKLMKKAYHSLKPDGTLYVMDMMTDSTHTNPRFSALFAVNMALTTDSGWVFSDSELKEWVEKAGFINFSVGSLPPPMPHWLATAKKPPH